MATAQQAQQKFKHEKSVIGDLTLLTLHGVIDETFEGRKIAESVKTQKVVLDLRDVRRFASWGMAEWMNLLNGSASRDLYLVECSTYAVSQMNLVTGLLGQGKLVSFYTPYRCGGCGEEFQKLMVVPRDRALIRDLANSEETCSTCGRMARVDKYPAAICAQISERPAFDVDDDVAAFLRTKLEYDLPADVTKFRAYRRVQKHYTYLRLTGNLTTLAAEPLALVTKGTAVLDLATVVFDPNGLAKWREYLQRASASGDATTIQLLDCPPGFLETAIAPEDLQGKVKVRTFAAVYPCPSCSTSSVAMIDVAQNLETLIEGQVPTAQCPTCRAEVAAAIAPEHVMRLPARERDGALDQFLVKSRNEPADKLEDAIALGRAQQKPAKASGGSKTPLIIGGTVAVLGIATAAVLVAQPWKSNAPAQPVIATADQAGIVAPKPEPKFTRPDWILSDVPSSAFCQDTVNRLVCVGVSAYRKTRDDGVAEASEAALEEMTNAIGLKIVEPFFKTHVLTAYSDARSKALASLQDEDTDRTSGPYAKASDTVRAARKRVVDILRASGGPAVPAQRSDWYWEEYTAEGGAGTEVLVFVRYDISIDAIKSLVETYSTPTQVLGSTVLTAFPELAWKHADFTGGAIVTKAGNPLSGAGVKDKQIVMTVDEQPVADATALTAKLAEKSGPVKLGVKAGDAAVRVVDVKR